MRTWRPEWLFRPAAVAIIPGQLKAPLLPPADMFVLAAVDWLRRWLRPNRALMVGRSRRPLTPELTEILTREREMRDDHDGWIFPHPDPEPVERVIGTA